MSDHARLSPSSAHRWTLCPASVSRSVGVAETESDAATLGTQAHELLEQLLKGEGGSAAKGLDGDDIVAVSEAYEYVRSKPVPFESEMQVDIGGQFGREDCWGTSDVVMFYPEMIEVVDYKHGAGIMVEPKENYQMLLYALGVYAKLKAELKPIPDTFRLTIIQPRIPHTDGTIRSWDVPTTTLVDWWGAFFDMAMMATDNPKPFAEASESACRWCGVKTQCPELALLSLQAAQTVFQPISQIEQPGLQERLSREPKDLTEAELLFVLDHADMISGWLKAIKGYALEQAVQGVPIAGFKVVAGRGSRAWTVDDDEIEKALRRLSKKDKKRLSKTDVLIEKLVSPAQAEKKLKPLMTPRSWENVLALIVKKEGKPAIARLSDPRNALPVNAADVFSPIKPTSDMPSFLE